MKRTQENPLPESLRGMFRDNTARHVWAHKVNVYHLEQDVHTEELSKYSAAQHPKPRDVAEKIIDAQVKKAVNAATEHNTQEDALKTLEVRVDSSEKKIAAAHAQKTNYYNVPGSVQEDLKGLNRELKSRQTEARHLREDLEKSNRRLPKNFRQPRHVPVADELPDTV